MREPIKSRGQTGGVFVLSGPCLSIVLASLGTSAAAVTLPQLSGAFAGHGFDPTLVVSSYILATTVLIVPAGRAGDVFGKRAVLLCGLSLYILGALLAVAAPTLTVLIAGRFVQGAGAAAMMAMPLALVRDLMPDDQIGRWMGALGTMSAIGTASGPAVGGAVVAAFGWRAVFALQVPFALVGVALCLLCIQNNRPAAHHKGVDVPGALALGVSLAAFTFLLSDLADGLDFGVALLAAVVGGGLAAFRAIEARAPSPIIPPDLLRSRHLRTSLAMNAVVSLVMIGMLVVGPFFLIDGLGLTTVQMGLTMSVGPISSALGGIPAGRLAEKIGAGRAVVMGASLMVLATAAMAGLPYVIGLAGFIAAFVVLALSYQVFLAALNTLVMQMASPEQQGVTSGVLNLSRNFGFILGAGSVSGVFSALSRLDLGFQDSAQGVRFAMAGTFAICCVLTLGMVILSLRALRRQPGT